MTAQEFYELGNEARKRGQWHEAINCYIQAIALDPDSPAVEAKRMLDDIMAFYCKDMYNPWQQQELIDCEECLPKCPQQIRIPNQMARIVELLRKR